MSKDVSQLSSLAYNMQFLEETSPQIKVLLIVHTTESFKMKTSQSLNQTKHACSMFQV